MRCGRSAPRSPGPRSLMGLVGPPFETALPAFGLTAEQTAAAILHYRSTYDPVAAQQSVLFPGIPALLEKLDAAGLRMAVATSKPERTATRIAVGLGIAERFALIGGSDPAVGRVGKGPVIASVLTRLSLDPDPQPGRDGRRPQPRRRGRDRERRARDRRGLGVRRAGRARGRPAGGAGPRRAVPGPTDDDPVWCPAVARLECRTARRGVCTLEEGRRAHPQPGGRRLERTTMRSVALSPAAREQALQAMADTELDVLVVGGGVVGAGCGARRRHARSDASGWSRPATSPPARPAARSKLIHGGLRYLEMLDFRLVAEALAERGLLIEKLAPHLVRPVPFLYPLKHRGWERLYAGSGVALYDTLSPAVGPVAGRARTTATSRAAAPAGWCRRCARTRWWARCSTTTPRSTTRGTRCSSPAPRPRTGRTSPTGRGSPGCCEEGERVVGAEVHDLESGETFDVRAQQVVNATGVWTDETQGLAGERGQFHVRASKGIHLVVPRDRIRGDSGLILRTEKSVLFVIPWGRHWIIGTTDTDWSLDKAHPAASAADIHYLLDHVNAVLRAAAHPRGRRGRLRGAAAAAVG